MMLHRFLDPGGFLECTRAFLESREAENNLILGVTATLVSNPELLKEAPYYACVEEAGDIRAAVMMTPPFGLVLSRAPSEALSMIVDDLVAAGTFIPGVNGPSDTSRIFARLWYDRTGKPMPLHRSLRVYQLAKVVPQQSFPGHLRSASESDLNVLADWVHHFNYEIGEPQTDDLIQESISARLKESRLYLWEDERIRSMASWGSPTTHGVRISLVYTPPEFRGRGYATACVATLSQTILDSGKKFCYLFTDLSNPTSNRIYQRIGYRPVCDFTEYRA